MVPLTLRRRALPAVSASLPTEGLAAAALLTALVLLSLYARMRATGDALWIDEGLSWGISSFPLLEIPGLLRQDGSPPLYYMLLNLWRELYPADETAMRVPSVAFAVLTVPIGFWAGRRLFGDRAGWAAAALFAFDPFVTIYAQEARMYSLLILLALLATVGFVEGFVHGRRGYLALFAGSLALMLYTHNWALFFAAAAAAALVVVAREQGERGRLARDGALAFGAAALLFLPWVPTLLFQIEHTGAPWSNVPGPTGITKGFASMLGGAPATVAIVLAAGAGLAPVVRAERSRERTVVYALAALALGTLVIAWLASQLSPAWAVRYLAVAVPPLLLLAGAGIARAPGRLGIGALALTAVFWAAQGVANDTPTTEKHALEKLSAPLERGDLVISTHPERLPVLHYYLPPGLRYATTLGPTTEPRVMDWRDALRRLKRSKVGVTLTPMLDRLPPGKSVLIVRPVTDQDVSWSAPWTSLVAKRSSVWSRRVAQDPRFVSLGSAPRELEGAQTGVRASLYVKVRN
jgi:mannosyltransferase